MKKLKVCYLILFFVLIFFNLSHANQINLAVSILPQKYFVQKIGGQQVKVMVMVQPGDNPATYEPKPSQMVALSKASLYMTIGVPFEQVWLDKFRSTNPDLKIIETAQGIEKRDMAKTYSYSSQEQDNKSKVMKDPHTWLSPPLVRIMAANIRDGLIRFDPAHKNIYRENFYRFVKEINQLDKQILEIFQKQDHKFSFLVYHPSWGYFAQAYGLRQETIEIMGKSPSPKQLSQLIQMARKKNIQAIFVQPQFSQKSAKTIAQNVGAEVISIDPLALNWKKNLLQVSQAIQAHLY